MVASQNFTTMSPYSLKAAPPRVVDLMSLDRGAFLKKPSMRSPAPYQERSKMVGTGDAPEYYGKAPGEMGLHCAPLQSAARRSAIWYWRAGQRVITADKRRRTGDGAPRTPRMLAGKRAIAGSAQPEADLLDDELPPSPGIAVRCSRDPKSTAGRGCPGSTCSGAACDWQPARSAHLLARYIIGEDRPRWIGDAPMAASSTAIHHARARECPAVAAQHTAPRHANGSK